MGKTLETKNEILKLLKERKMTVTEISETLGLAKSTISQHISELVNTGVIDQEDNTHFKKMRYYKIVRKGVHTSEDNGVHNKYVIGISVIVSIGAMFFIIAVIGFNHAPISKTTTVSINYPNGGVACQILLFFRNPNSTEIYNIINGIANGNPCYMTYIAANGSKFTANMGGLGYASHNGTLSVPSRNFTYLISGKQISNLESNVDNGYCYDEEALKFFNVSFTVHAVKCRTAIFG